MRLISSTDTRPYATCLEPRRPAYPHGDLTLRPCSQRRDGRSQRSSVIIICTAPKTKEFLTCGCHSDLNASIGSMAAARTAG